MSVSVFPVTTESMDLVNVSFYLFKKQIHPVKINQSTGIPDEPPPPPPPVVTPTTGIDNSLNYTTSAFTPETVIEIKSCMCIAHEPD